MIYSRQLHFNSGCEWLSSNSVKRLVCMVKRAPSFGFGACSFGRKTWGQGFGPVKLDRSGNKRAFWYMFEASDPDYTSTAPDYFASVATSARAAAAAT